MIKSDEEGNLYTFINNDGFFEINGLGNEGNVRICICGEEEVIKTYPASDKIKVELTKQDIENIGVGSHRYYIDLIKGNHLDTIICQAFIVSER